MEKVKVHFTEQQLVLLRKMMDERGDRRDFGAVALEMFRDYARQVLGREYKNS